MILNTTKPLTPECLTQVILSQTDNERNHLAIPIPNSISVSTFPLIRVRVCPSVSMPEPWLNVMLGNSALLSAHPNFARSLLWFSPVLFSNPFYLLSPVQSSNSVCYYSSPRTLPAGQIRLLVARHPSSPLSYLLISTHAIPLPSVPPCLSLYIHKHLACISSFSIYVLSTYCGLDTGETTLANRENFALVEFRFLEQEADNKL